MPFPFIAAAIAAAAVSTISSAIATEAQVEAAEKENKVNRRVANIERVQRQKRAIAERRQIEAEIIQGGETSGTRTNSAISGAVGSLRSDTASSIGLSNTQFAGDTLSNQYYLQGVRKAGTFGTIANVADTAASIFSYGAAAKRPGGGGNRT